MVRLNARILMTTIANLLAALEPSLDQLGTHSNQGSIIAKRQP